MKLVAKILLVFFILIVLAAVSVKLIVGAVNFPVGSSEVDQSKLSERIMLPDGFAYNVFADDVPNARMLRMTRSGDVLVATPNRDQVLLLKRDSNGDGRHDGKQVLLDQLNGPNGLDFYQDWLYVAEDHGIGRIKFDHEAGAVVGDYENIVSGWPEGGNHWKKTLRLGPDGLIYVTVGSTCNVCIEDDELRATMVRYRPDGSGEEIYATGLRNSAGFDWNRDAELYATDNGRDMLGDDYPPCELNKIEAGKFYGWPFANGNNEPDPDLGAGNEDRIKNSVPMVHGFRAHNAPLGIHFLRSDNLPQDYREAALVALHGSWNRSEKDGYKVVSLHWDDMGNIVEKDFMSGFLRDDNVIGRPAEITEGSDGAIYISDDYAGAIYRVTLKD